MNYSEAVEELKKYLKQYTESITTKSKGINKYICPLCNSGTGTHKTGAFSITDNGIKWHCFSCGRGGDIIDLIKEHEHISDNGQALQKGLDLFGINTEYQNKTKNEQYTHNHIHTNTYTHTYTHHTEAGQEMDFTEYYKQCVNDIGLTDYPKERGLTETIIKQYGIGFDKRINRLIIPINKGYYKGRDTTGTAEPKYLIPKGATVSLFNINALWNEVKPCFVVEGEIDALSIIQAGGYAVALGSTSNYRKIIEAIKQKTPVQPLIILMDNDKGGTDATASLEKELKALSTKYIVSSLNAPYKDCNEMLVKDSQTFIDAVIEAEKKATQESEREHERQKAEYILKNSTASYLQSFINGIAESVNTNYIPTGFSKLDEILDGGFYEGLYCIGAVSSLGKTTLMLQVCDQIAQAGTDVLIFSLEMARTELIAKSISRQTILNIIATGGETKHAKTTRGITTGSRYPNYSTAEKELINKSIADYSQIAKHLYITEASEEDIGINTIRKAIEDHISFTGNRPIVLIDYLQILNLDEPHKTDKQLIDKAVRDLKRISRKYKLPIVAISSLNRGNYSEAINETAFKESGAIEYGSDILIGLQFKGAGEQKFNIQEAKSQNPRQIELKILKNRNGRTGVTVDYKYYPLFNYFEEV